MTNPKLIRVLTLSLLVLGLAACGSTGSSSVSPSSTSDSTSEAPSSSGDSTSSLADWIDYAENGTVTLGLDYSGHSFLTDGVCQATLKTCIDGDTAHFYDLDGTSIVKARFYGVDTPESTGKVQPYGKQASMYTKGILNDAAANGTIVLSSPTNEYGAPEPDSTGSRYVTLIWVNVEKKNAPLDELYLLNLMLVEYGYSNVKNVLDMPDYVETFYRAEDQAKAYKLKLFSGEPDPYYNYEGYKDTDLLSIKREIEKQIEDPDYANAYDNENVRIQGTVAGFSNNVLYLQNFYTEEEGAIYPEGEYAGLNIFVGMSAIPSKFTRINSYIQVAGVCSNSENFGFQMSGCSFPTIVYDETYDAQVLISAADNTEEHALYTFGYSIEGLNQAIAGKTYDALYSRVAISDIVTVTRVYTGTDGDITLYFGNNEFNAYVPFSYKGDTTKPNWIWTGDDFLNKSFQITGVLSIHLTTSRVYKFQICPSNSTELVWQGE